MKAEAIRALDDDALNRLIAEGIGLGHVCVWKNHGPKEFDGEAWYEWRCEVCNKLAEIGSKTIPPTSPPNFARDFNARLATKEREGFDGPVMWLKPHYQPGASWVGDENKHHHAIARVMQCRDVPQLVDDGPRPFAEDCAIALDSVKEPTDD